MNNSHYIITFDDAYLDGRNFNIESNQTIHGRLMLLALVPMDQSQPYEYTYQLVGGGNEYAYVFDDVIVQDIISKIEVYGGQSNNEYKFIGDVIGLYSDEYLDAHAGMTDITHAWLPLNESNNIYISLDPNYSTPSGNKSNKVLRTLATGQSDITRHEAYTKVTGLNEFNSLTPSYTNKQNSLILNEMLEIVKKYVPEATEVVLRLRDLSSPEAIYDYRYAYLAAVFPVQYDGEDEIVYGNAVCFIVDEDRGEETEAFDCIRIGCNTNEQHTYTLDGYYSIPTTCTGISDIGLMLFDEYEYEYESIRISSADFIELYNLSSNLANVNAKICYSVTLK